MTRCFERAVGWALGVVLLAAGGPQALAQNAKTLFRELPGGEEAAFAARPIETSGPAVARRRFAAWESKAWRSAAQSESQRIVFNLFSDARLSFQLDRGRRSAATASRVWRGRRADSGAYFVAVEGDDGFHARIFDGAARYYKVRPAQGATHEIQEVLPTEIVWENDALVPPLPAGKEASAPPVAYAGKAVIDVLVAYTAAARQREGSASAIEALAEATVAEANVGFSNSGIDLEMRLAGVKEVSLPSGEAANGGYLSTVTGYSALEALRNQLGADIVSVWIDGPGAFGGTVGIGWVMQAVGSNFAPYAYNIVEVNFAESPAFTFAHEAGHNLGSAHDRENAGVAGAYPYSYGYQQDVASPRFKTIMAYSRFCSGGCASINHWSNPNVIYSGNPTGVAGGSDAADNARTLNQSGPVAATFRPTVVSSNVAPEPVSISPSSGSGLAPIFTAVFADDNGATDIRSGYLLINNGFVGSSACWLEYNRRDGRLLLVNDAGTGMVGSITPGSGSLSNSQCTVYGAGASASTAGDRLTVRFPLAFQSSFSGARNLYISAVDASGLNSGWSLAGEWTPAEGGPQPPSVIGTSPSSGAGSTQDFTATYTDPNGGADISGVSFLVNNTLNGRNACWVVHNRFAGRFHLIDDNGAASAGSVTAGASGIVSNSQCSLHGAGVSSTANGNLLTATFPLTFDPSFSGAKNVYISAQDANGAMSGWHLVGSWTAQTDGRQPPTVGSVSPSGGSGAVQSFTASYRDGNGAADLAAALFLVNDGLRGVNACWISYDPSNGRFRLISDAGDSLAGYVTAGSGIVSNSQCSLRGAGASAVASGDTLTVTFPVTFQSGFSGPKDIFLNARDAAGAESGWQLASSWTAP